MPYILPTRQKPKHKTPIDEAVSILKQHINFYLAPFVDGERFQDWAKSDMFMYEISRDLKQGLPQSERYIQNYSKQAGSRFPSDLDTDIEHFFHYIQDYTLENKIRFLNKYGFFNPAYDISLNHSKNAAEAAIKSLNLENLTETDVKNLITAYKADTFAASLAALKNGDESAIRQQLELNSKLTNAIIKTQDNKAIKNWEIEHQKITLSISADALKSMMDNGRTLIDREEENRPGMFGQSLANYTDNLERYLQNDQLHNLYFAAATAIEAIDLIEQDEFPIEQLTRLQHILKRANKKEFLLSENKKLGDGLKKLANSLIKEINAISPNPTSYAAIKKLVTFEVKRNNTYIRENHFSDNEQSFSHYLTYLKQQFGEDVDIPEIQLEKLAILHLQDNISSRALSNSFSDAIVDFLMNEFSMSNDMVRLIISNDDLSYSFQDNIIYVNITGNLSLKNINAGSSDNIGTLETTLKIDKTGKVTLEKININTGIPNSELHKTIIEKLKTNLAATCDNEDSLNAKLNIEKEQIEGKIATHLQDVETKLTFDSEALEELTKHEQDIYSNQQLESPIHSLAENLQSFPPKLKQYWSNKELHNAYTAALYIVETLQQEAPDFKKLNQILTDLNLGIDLPYYHDDASELSLGLATTVFVKELIQSIAEKWPGENKSEIDYRHFEEMAEEVARYNSYIPANFHPEMKESHYKHLQYIKQTYCTEDCTLPDAQIMAIANTMLQANISNFAMQHTLKGVLNSIAMIIIPLEKEYTLYSTRASNQQFTYKISNDGIVFELTADITQQKEISERTIDTDTKKVVIRRNVQKDIKLGTCSLKGHLDFEGNLSYDNLDVHTHSFTKAHAQQLRQNLVDIAQAVETKETYSELKFSKGCIDSHRQFNIKLNSELLTQLSNQQGTNYSRESNLIFNKLSTFLATNKTIDIKEIRQLNSAIANINDELNYYSASIDSILKQLNFDTLNSDYKRLSIDEKLNIALQELAENNQINAPYEFDTLVQSTIDEKLTFILKDQPDNSYQERIQNFNKKINHLNLNQTFESFADLAKLQSTLDAKLQNMTDFVFSPVTNIVHEAILGKILGQLSIDKENVDAIILSSNDENTNDNISIHISAPIHFQANNATDTDEIGKFNCDISVDKNGNVSYSNINVQIESPSDNFEAVALKTIKENTGKTSTLEGDTYYFDFDEKDLKHNNTDTISIKITPDAIQSMQKSEKDDYPHLHAFSQMTKVVNDSIASVKSAFLSTERVKVLTTMLFVAEIKNDIRHIQNNKRTTPNAKKQALAKRFSTLKADLKKFDLFKINDCYDLEQIKLENVDDLAKFEETITKSLKSYSFMQDKKSLQSFSNAAGDLPRNSNYIPDSFSKTKNLANYLDYLKSTEPKNGDLKPDFINAMKKALLTIQGGPVLGGIKFTYATFPSAIFETIYLALDMKDKYVFVVDSKNAHVDAYEDENGTLNFSLTGQVAHKSQPEGAGDYTVKFYIDENSQLHFGDIEINLNLPDPEIKKAIEYTMTKQLAVIKSPNKPNSYQITAESLSSRTVNAIAAAKEVKTKPTSSNYIDLYPIEEEKAFKAQAEAKAKQLQKPSIFSKALPVIAGIGFSTLCVTAAIIGGPIGIGLGIIGGLGLLTTTVAKVMYDNKAAMSGPTAAPATVKKITPEQDQMIDELCKIREFNFEASPTTAKEEVKVETTSKDSNEQSTYANLLITTRLDDISNSEKSKKSEKTDDEENLIVIDPQQQLDDANHLPKPSTKVITGVNESIEKVRETEATLKQSSAEYTKNASEHYFDLFKNNQPYQPYRPQTTSKPGDDNKLTVDDRRPQIGVFS